MAAQNWTPLVELDQWKLIKKSRLCRLFNATFAMLRTSNFRESRREHSCYVMQSCKMKLTSKFLAESNYVMSSIRYTFIGL